MSRRRRSSIAVLSLSFLMLLPLPALAAGRSAGPVEAARGALATLWQSLLAIVNSSFGQPLSERGPTMDPLGQPPASQADERPLSDLGPGMDPLG
jgi:hypothetical protein